MSYDQRPSRIKLVSSGPAAPSPEVAADGAPDAASASDPSLTEASADAAADGTRGRSPIVTAILFLVGSAIGGAGLAAWPHLIG